MHGGRAAFLHTQPCSNPFAIRLRLVQTGFKLRFYRLDSDFKTKNHALEESRELCRRVCHFPWTRPSALHLHGHCIEMRMHLGGVID